MNDEYGFLNYDYMIWDKGDATNQYCDFLAILDRELCDYELTLAVL